jgi:hypothetical protein
VIFWKDFILDDEIGPYLKIGISDPKSRESKDVYPGVREDAIQETGQEKQPARMVGYSSLDLIQSSKEAGLGKQLSRLRGRER